MRAVLVRHHGGPEALQVSEIAEPQAGIGEVVVQVHACAVNHLDLWLRKGAPGAKLELPRIPGSDIAGQVVTVGPGVTGVQPGDRVLVSPGLSCGTCEHCLEGRDQLCRQFRVLGHHVDGGYAERVRVPAANLVPLPDGVDLTRAAALPVTYLTAWNMLVNAAGLRGGETVLIWGASSGLGSAAVQIAHLLGARVIGTAGSEWKVGRLREWGIEALNHSQEEVPAQVRKLTGGRGAEVVFEHIGAATWERSMQSLGRGGRLVSCGVTTGYTGATDLRHLFAKELQIKGCHMGRKADLHKILPLFAAGRLNPVIGEQFDLAEATAAHRLMESREHFGKLVLRL